MPNPETSDGQPKELIDQEVDIGQTCQNNLVEAIKSAASGLSPDTIQRLYQPELEMLSDPSPEGWESPQEIRQMQTAQLEKYRTGVHNVRHASQSISETTTDHVDRSLGLDKPHDFGRAMIIIQELRYMYDRKDQLNPARGNNRLNLRQKSGGKPDGQDGVTHYDRLEHSQTFYTLLGIDKQNPEIIQPADNPSTTISKFATSIPNISLIHSVKDPDDTAHRHEWDYLEVETTSQDQG